MKGDDMTTERLEAELRDVFAHQAASIDTQPRRFEGPAEAPSAVATLEVSDDVAERHRFSRPRAFAAGIGVLATAAAIALFVASMSPSATHTKQPTDSAARVMTALDKTVHEGSFVAHYSIKEQLGTPPAGSNSAQGPSPDLNGAATINVNPVSVSSTLTIANIAGPILIEADANSVTDTNGVGGSKSTTKWPLPDFVGQATASLGNRSGAVSLLTLASPYGYLAMTDDAVRVATPIGHQKVDGTNLALFDVPMSPAEMAHVPTSSPDQAKAIEIALAELRQEGYAGTDMRVGIGSDGLIHYAVATAHFADHGTVTLTAILSDFGCEATAAVRSPGGSCQTTALSKPVTPTT